MHIIPQYKLNIYHRLDNVLNFTGQVGYIWAMYRIPQDRLCVHHGLFAAHLSDFVCLFYLLYQ
jgi:hypothetical protein